MMVNRLILTAYVISLILLFSGTAGIYLNGYRQFFMIFMNFMVIKNDGLIFDVDEGGKRLSKTCPISINGSFACSGIGPVSGCLSYPHK